MFVRGACCGKRDLESFECCGQKTRLRQEACCAAILIRAGLERARQETIEVGHAAVLPAERIVERKDFADEARPEVEWRLAAGRLRRMRRPAQQDFAIERRQRIRRARQPLA